MNMDESQERARLQRTIVVLIGLGIALIAGVIANLCIGSVSISIADAFHDLISGASNSQEYQILWQIRLPRLTACVILGGALALSGFMLQTFFNNPIASPYILGISSGAKLALCLVTVVVMGAHHAIAPWMTIAAAFVGSLAAMLFVMAIARRVKSAALLIVAGVMVGYLFSAGTDFLIAFANDSGVANLYTWALGSFSGTTWKDVLVMFVVITAASIATFMLSKPMGAFQLGEEYAKSMGVNVKFFRMALIILSSLLAATVTAYAGPISFVGIAVPHVVKALLGSSKPIRVIPACLLGGSVFCLICDLIARSLFAPTELTLSAVTAVFGAPVVIAVLMKKRGIR